MATFVPQLTYNNPDDVYTSNYYQAGGSTYYDMPNCVRYAYGRWWALLGAEPTFMRHLGNGGNWYRNAPGNILRGDTPKLGAIICMDGGPGMGVGHVAVVEKIYSNGAITCSQSGYTRKPELINRYMFWTTTGPRSNHYGFSASYVYQGFLYLPTDYDPDIDPDDPPGPGPTPPDPDEPYPRKLLLYKKQIYRNQGRLGTDVYT